MHKAVLEMGLSCKCQNAFKIQQIFWIYARNHIITSLSPLSVNCSPWMYKSIAGIFKELFVQNICVNPSKLVFCDVQCTMRSKNQGVTSYLHGSFKIIYLFENQKQSYIFECRLSLLLTNKLSVITQFWIYPRFYYFFGVLLTQISEKYI